MAYLDPKALAAAGFTDEIKPRAASAVISIAGLEGSGKTTWALTAPKPLFWLRRRLREMRRAAGDPGISMCSPTV